MIYWVVTYVLVTLLLYIIWYGVHQIRKLRDDLRLSHTQLSRLREAVHIDEWRRRRQEECDRAAHWDWFNKASKGPFLDKPEIDLEFYDPEGHPVAQTKAELTVHVNKFGVVVQAVSRLTASSHDLRIGSYSVWFGDNCEPGHQMEPRMVAKGDTYVQSLAVPIRLSGGITQLDIDPPGNVQPFPGPVRNTARS